MCYNHINLGRVVLSLALSALLYAAGRVIALEARLAALESRA